MVGLDPATPSYSSGQRPSSAVGPGRVTVRYNDGLLWPVEVDKLRVVAGRSGSASCAVHRTAGLTKQADMPVSSRDESIDGADWSVVTSLTGSTCASERDRRPSTFGGSSQTAHAKVSRRDEIPALLHPLFRTALAIGKVPTEWSARLSYNDWTAGNSGVELRQARDDLMACELESWRRKAELAASTAEVSGDWWHIQAATQLVTSAGVGSRWTERLKQELNCWTARCYPARLPSMCGIVIFVESAAGRVQPRVGHGCCPQTAPPQQLVDPHERREKAASLRKRIARGPSERFESLVGAVGHAVCKCSC